MKSLKDRLIEMLRYGHLFQQANLKLIEQDVNLFLYREFGKQIKPVSLEMPEPGHIVPGNFYSALVIEIEGINPDSIPQSIIDGKMTEWKFGDYTFTFKDGQLITHHNINKIDLNNNHD